MGFKKIVTKKIGSDGRLHYTTTSTLKKVDEREFTRSVAMEYLYKISYEIDNNEYALLEADNQGFLFTGSGIKK